MAITMPIKNIANVIVIAIAILIDVAKVNAISIVIACTFALPLSLR